jgi:muramidase (phage lysozyme)
LNPKIPKPAAYLLDFIASIEAPRGYDTVYGNRMDKMPKPLTSMTMKEVLDQGNWRTKTFGSSACGRYQFMDATLRSLAAAYDLKAEDKFTPDYQDDLGYKLLQGRKYARWISGQITDEEFMWALAKEWASFPVPEAGQGAHRRLQAGETYYAGDKLNKVLVKVPQVKQALKEAKALVNEVPASDEPEELLYTLDEVRKAVEAGVAEALRARAKQRVVLALTFEDGRLVGTSELAGEAAKAS